MSAHCNCEFLVPVNVKHFEQDVNLEAIDYSIDEENQKCAMSIPKYVSYRRFDYIGKSFGSIDEIYKFKLQVDIQNTKVNFQNHYDSFGTYLGFDFLKHLKI